METIETVLFLLKTVALVLFLLSTNLCKLFTTEDGKLKLIGWIIMVTIGIVYTISDLSIHIIQKRKEKCKSKNHYKIIIYWLIIIIIISLYIGIGVSLYKNQIELKYQNKITRERIDNLWGKQYLNVFKLYEEFSEDLMKYPPEAFPAIPEQPTGQINITFPNDNSSARNRELVGGNIIEPNTELFVIVHPMKRSAYWVQTIPTVHKDGTWKTEVYLGGPNDIGEHFEIMAVAHPETSIQEGMVLSTWPKAKWRSNIIEVIRK